MRTQTVRARGPKAGSKASSDGLDVKGGSSSVDAPTKQPATPAPVDGDSAEGNGMDTGRRGVRPPACVPWPQLLVLTAAEYLKMPLLVAICVHLLRPHWHHVTAWVHPATEPVVFVVGSWVIHETLYIVMNGFFMLCDTYGWMADRRLPRKPAQIPSKALIRRTLVQVAISHGIFQWLGLYLAWLSFEYQGTSFYAALPDFRTTLVQLAVSSVWLDFSFYWSHRMLHLPWFYKRVHKQHHEFVGTMGIAAEYAHWFEDLFSAQIPTALVLALYGCHTMVWFFWLSWRLFETYESHSGYVFPWLHGYTTCYHDYHHTVNIGNFAGGPFWDTLCGTNDYWTRKVHAGETPGQKMQKRWSGEAE